MKERCTLLSNEIVISDKMVLSLQERIFLVEHTFRCNGEFTEEVRNRFKAAFPNSDVPHRNSVRSLIAKFRETGSVHDACRSGRDPILTDEKINNISEAMARSPNKSVRRLSDEVDISVGSAHNALRKTLKLHPYKISCYHELKEADYEKRVQFCRWFRQFLDNDDVLNKTFFSDEAWFHLSGYVNSQNYRHWSSDNPHEFIEKPLHSIKTGVWCAMSRRRIIGPIFFHETINAERYWKNLIVPFLDELTREERRHGYFQQDGAPPHTANVTLRRLNEVFPERVISTGIWPPRSPDLSALDFYLWGAVKEAVYKKKPRNLEELQNEISEHIRNISERELNSVFDSMRKRVDLCVLQGGGHFQQLL